MNEFKERKLAEFEKQFGIPDYMNDLLKEPLKVVIEEQKQFISDLIDEVEQKIHKPYIAKELGYYNSGGNDHFYELIKNLNNK